MAKSDWEEVKIFFNTKYPNLLSDFINSNQVFLPSKNNPLAHENLNFSANQLGKSKPGNWIPLYHIKELSPYFIENNIYPIRAGQAEFFFFKGNIFYDLSTLTFTSITKEQYIPIEDFVPISLSVNFQRNENAYLQ